MLDEQSIATLEELLDKTHSAHRRLVARLRDAEKEVENLRLEIAAHENSARGIDNLLVTMRGGRSLGKNLTIEDDVEARTTQHERGETRPNVQDVQTKELRRDSSVAYFNQNRGKSMLHSDFEPASNRFNDRTITQSCTLLLREAGGPLHVNELYHLLVAGGMKFKGNNPTISVAVSLSRNRRFRKVDPGTFDLVIREALQAAS